MDLSLSDWLLNKAEANKSRINNNKFKLGKNKIKNKGKKTEKGKRLQLKKDNRLLALIFVSALPSSRQVLFEYKMQWFFFDFVNASHTHEKVVAKPGTTAEHCPIALIT